MTKLKGLIIVVCLSVVFFAGCKTLEPSKVVLLPEDRIYSVPAGAKIHVILDKKDLGEMVFPYEMKLAHASVFERNEQQLNDMAISQIKKDKQSKQTAGIFGGILTIAGALAGAWAKGAFTKKKTTV